MCCKLFYIDCILDNCKIEEEYLAQVRWRDPCSFLAKLHGG